MYYVIFKDRQGYWRWSLYSANNRILADSGEGYVNKVDCRHGLDLTASSAGVPVRERY